jgi:hypothetical protein
MDAIDNIGTDLDTVVRMETHSDYASIAPQASSVVATVGDFVYPQVRHVSLTFIGNILGTDEAYSIWIWVKDSPTTTTPKILDYLTPGTYDGTILNYEFDTDHWRIQIHKEPVLPALTLNYHATSIYSTD